MSGPLETLRLLHVFSVRDVAVGQKARRSHEGALVVRRRRHLRRARGSQAQRAGEVLAQLLRRLRAGSIQKDLCARRGGVSCLGSV